MYSNQVLQEEGVESRAEPPFQPLNKIQEGIAAQTPIFCFPGAGANSTCFLSLAESLGLEPTIIGVDQRGLDGQRLPFESIEEAAECYARHIMQTRSGSSVRFVTHSYGSWLGFQTGLLLQERGVNVDSIFIIDSLPPSELGVLRRHCDRLYCFNHLVKLLAQTSGREINFDVADLKDLTEQAQLEVLIDVMKFFGIIPKRAAVASIRAFIDVFIANLNTAYLPKSSFEGKVVLCLASESERESVLVSTSEIVSGWRKFAPNLMKIEFDGNHMSILKNPDLGRYIGCG